MRVWRDLDHDAVADDGELQSLAQAGISAINLAATPKTGIFSAGNQIAATGSFTRADGSTSMVADVWFRLDNFRSQYLGDRTISAEAAALPEIKGYGTLTDLRIAMTQSPALAEVVRTVLPTLTMLDLPSLRLAATPIFTAWAKSVKLPDGNGVLQTIDPAQRANVPIRLSDDDKLADFAYQVTDVDGSYWKLATAATAATVKDAEGVVLPRPSLEQIMAQSGNWTVFKGEHIGFLERYMGETIPWGQAPENPDKALSVLKQMISTFWSSFNLLTVRLASQGPLAPYFDGITYNVTEDNFRPSTSRQLIPMFEAIFRAAPHDAAAASTWLTEWKPILDIVLGDFDRGAEHLLVTHGYLFSNIVAAYESVGSVGLAVDIRAAAGALGVPSELIVTGSGELTGGNDADLIYMSAGDQVARGGIGPDTYVFGRNFGHDIIDDVEEVAQAHDPDTIRFADIKSTEIFAVREGLDLILRVKDTLDEVRVLRQFEGKIPSLFGGDLSAETGIKEIIFADGVVWDMMDIARAASHPLDSDDTLTGTAEVDYLDGGRGNDTLSGGDDTDIYRFDRGYGHDVVSERQSNILIDGPDAVSFGPGLTREDIIFKRVGSSNDLLIEVAGTTDALTIHGQFSATYTGPFGTQWMSRIETFVFDDGSDLSWKDVIETIQATAGTEGDDTIYGFDLEDVLDGGAGDDFLSGGNENDVYKFGLGYGRDVIYEGLDNILSGTFDVLEFGAGIDPNSVLLQRDGDSSDLIITLADGSQMTIRNQFGVVDSGPFGRIYFNRIEEFRFKDDAQTVWNTEYIINRLLRQQATDGNDTIHGFFRQDILEGGLGNDYLAGGEDGDSYLFGLGDGQDVIKDYGSNILANAPDKIIFKDGISPDDLILTRDEAVFIIRFKNSTDSITIKSQFNTNSLAMRMWEIEEFHFADGTIWLRQDIQDRLLQSTSGDDMLVGFWSEDTLDGGAGNDTLMGGECTDTYIFGLGYGHDVVADDRWIIFSTDQDRVVFKPGISPDDLLLTRIGDDLHVRLKQSDDTLMIDSQYYMAFGFNHIEWFEFADGTIWGYDEIKDRYLVQMRTDGNDSLAGLTGTDTLDGGAGNDLLLGGKGDDIYVFARGYGHDRIEDDDTMNPGYDAIIFGSDVSPGDLRFSRGGSNANDLYISIAGTDDRLTVTGGLDGARPRIEELRFSDGTVLVYADVLAALLTPTADNDIIYGDSQANIVAGADGNDTLDGRGGDDSLLGGNGNDRLLGAHGSDTLIGGAGSDVLLGDSEGDTYIFNRGDGQDRIEDWDYWGPEGDDTLVFGPGIMPADLILARTGDNSNDLTLTVTGTTDKITISNYFESARYHIEYLTFSDGTIWDYKTIFDRLSTPTESNDTLYGDTKANIILGLGGDDYIEARDGDDTIDGGAGNDIMIGWKGEDVYIFGRGYGQDTIDDWDYPQSGIDAISFNADVLPDDIVLARSVTAPNNLHIAISGSTDSLTIRSYITSKGQRIEEFRFADGTIWDSTRIQQALPTGTANSDILSGSFVSELLEGLDGDDTLIGQGGADTLRAGTGSDSYVFGFGDGQDRIEEGGGTDVIQLKAGVTAADIRLWRNGNDLQLSLGDGADSLRIYDHYYAASRQVEILRFADGTEWSLTGGLTFTGSAASETVNATSGDDTLIGQGGADTLNGSDGNDTLMGGLGNDVLAGGVGNDVYFFGLGQGQDVITDGTSSFDQIQLMPDVTPSDVMLSLSGANLVVSIVGTADKVTVNAFTTAVGNRIDAIRFADGTVWNYQTISTKLLSGTSGNETLLGLTGNDIFTGSKGNDRMEDTAGSDTYSYAIGDGSDWIRDSGAATDIDRLVLGAGITEAEVKLSRDTGDTEDLKLSFTVSGGSVVLDNQFWTNSWGMERVEFASGAVWMQADMQTRYLALANGIGNDTIYGFGGDDTFTVGKGNDWMEDTGGSDSYAYAKGDGNDWIRDGGGATDIDRLVLGAGITEAEVKLSRNSSNPSDLKLTFIISGGSVTLDNQFYTSAWGIERIEFADGAVWGAAPSCRAAISP